MYCQTKHSGRFQDKINAWKFIKLKWTMRSAMFIKYYVCQPTHLIINTYLLVLRIGENIKQAALSNYSI